MDKIQALQEIFEAMTPDQLHKFEKEHQVVLTFLLKMADEAIRDQGAN